MMFYGAEWEPEDVIETAEMMHHEYYWLHLAELKHFSIKAKAGEYNVKRSRSIRNEDGDYQGAEEYDGKIYGKLAPIHLMKWIAEYASESLYHRSQINWDKKPAAQIEAPGTIDVRAKLAEFTYNAFGKPKQDVTAQDEAIYQIEREKARKAQETRQQEHLAQLKRREQEENQNKQP